MNDYSQLRLEVSVLLDTLVDDALDTTEQVRLNELLRRHPEARRDFREYLALHAVMSWEGVEQVMSESMRKAIGASPPPLVIPSRSPGLGALSRTTATINRPVFWATLAAGMLFAGYIVTISWNMLGRQLVNNDDSSHRHAAVATIRDAIDATWSEASATPLTNSSTHSRVITSGERLAISSGLVELRLNQGATLFIEGPAEWTIDGGNTATLKEGKLVANVPESAIGFTLETPSARIVDLGTEFNVEVKKNQITTVDVTRGKVQVSPIQQAGGAPIQPIMLTPSAGSLAINPHTREVTVSAAPKEAQPGFATRKKLFGSHDKTGARRSQLLSDPVLVAHYSFDLPTLPSAIKNNAPGANGKFDLEVNGCVITDGSHADRSAIAFREPKDWLATNIPGDFDALTMIGIVKFSKPRPQYAGLVMSDLWETPGQLHWQITPAGELQLAILGVAGARDIYSQWIVDRDRWLITAVAVDTKKQTAAFYVDGALISEQDLKLDIPLRLGPLRIGNWRASSDFTADRCLDGSMEELAIFSRALTGEEIRWFTP